MATIVFEALSEPTSNPRIDDAASFMFATRFQSASDLEGATDVRLRMTMTAADVSREYDALLVDVMPHVQFGDVITIGDGYSFAYEEQLPVPDVSILVGYARHSLLLTEFYSTYDDLSFSTGNTARFTEGDEIRASAEIAAVVREPTVIDNYFSAFMSPGYLFAWGSLEIASLADTVRVADSTSASLITVIADILALHGSVAVSLSASGRMADTIAFTDALKNVFGAVLSDGYQLSEVISGSRYSIVEAVDALVLSGVVTGYAQAIAVTAEVFALSDALNNVQIAATSDGMSLNETLAASIMAYASIVDEIMLSDDASMNGVFACAVHDTMVLDDSVTVSGLLAAVMRDELSLIGRLRIAGEPYSAYVINTATLGYSTYTGFNFGSMAVVQGKLYATADDGLYLLEGDDDDGSAIKTKVRTGLSSMGVSRMKRVPSAYIGIDTRGVVVIKAIVTSPNGQKESHWYTATPTDTGSLRERRTKIGRGLRSVYWAFELATYDGEDFMLDGIELHVMALERKI